MDRAYEGNETCHPGLDLNFIPVVPPKTTRIESMGYRPPTVVRSPKPTPCIYPDPVDTIEPQIRAPMRDVFDLGPASLPLRIQKFRLF